MLAFSLFARASTALAGMRPLNLGASRTWLSRERERSLNSGSRERRVSCFVSGANREEFINANPRADAPKPVRAVRRLMPLSAERERILPPSNREVANEYIYPLLARTTLCRPLFYSPFDTRVRYQPHHRNDDVARASNPWFRKCERNCSPINCD